MRALLTLLVCSPLLAQAAVADTRLEIRVYEQDQIVEVIGSPRLVTQILLNQDEQILDAVIGDSTEWSIITARGEHALFVQPHEGARASNLIVTTDRRNYTFELVPMSSTARGGRLVPAYRVQFLYPDSLTNPVAPGYARDRRAAHWNSSYSMQATADAESILPDAAGDDGRRTYLHFASRVELPVPFAVAEDRTESLVNLHMDAEWMVLHGVYHRVALRLGQAVVGIWNEKWTTSQIESVQDSSRLDRSGIDLDDGP